MTTLAELALAHTDLAPHELEHLQRLLGSWSILADLSFSDLLLVVPSSAASSATPGGAAPGSAAPGSAGRRGEERGDAGEGEPELVVLGQIRPSNRPTLIAEDLVGQTMRRSSWSLAAAALDTGEIVRGSVHHPMIGESVPVDNVPVRCGVKVVAAMVRVYSRSPSAPVSPFEKNYRHVFDRLVQMVTESAFPFPGVDVGTEETPRVGDGFVLVGADGRVEFASPNAINAFHRMGVYSPTEGHRLSELDVEVSSVDLALTAGRPVVEEVERRPDVMVLVHCIPLLSANTVTGAVILLRDVTDVRRLDRLLLSKDAAIREVHHRVKNNLQTISSLLSLQARRVGEGEGRDALREAERRVRSIALVHEILSRDPGDQVPFGEIVESLVQMAADSVVSARPISIDVAGDLGEVTADVATPLAVILAEVLQNAVEHAFCGEAPDAGDPDGGRRPGAGAPAGEQGHVWVTLDHDEGCLSVVVRDDGRGLEEGFDIDQTSSLGLSIVRDLVVSQLGGTITMGNAGGDAASPTGHGTVVAVRLPPP